MAENYGRDVVQEGACARYVQCSGAGPRKRLSLVLLKGTNGLHGVGSTGEITIERNRV